jgi:hypothetical protein
MRRVRLSQAGLTVAALALATPNAWGQSANDFRLPSGSPTPTTRAQGPVTPDNPVVTPARPTPSAAPSPISPTVAPTINPAPSQRFPGPTTKRIEPRTNLPIRPIPGPTLVPPAGTLPAPTSPATPPLGFPSSDTATASTSIAPPLTAVKTDTASPWPWALGVLGILATAIGGAVWWRRRRAEAPLAITFEPPVVSEAVPVQPPPIAEPEPKPIAAAPPADPPSGIALALAATRMSASLMATTLSYRLTLTNHTDAALSGLAIEGDMIAAQAQVSVDRQVANPAEHLEHRHGPATLGPGETIEFSGDIRVPLNAIVPIRAGTHALFIPLARFRIEAGVEGRGRIAVTRTYVVGEEAEAAGGQLKPFRLDLGPRVYSRLGQRAVN